MHEGERGQAQHGRHEVGGDLVGQALDRGLGALRVLDQPDDLGERGIFADAGGAEGEASRSC